MESSGPAASPSVEKSRCSLSYIKSIWVGYFCFSSSMGKLKKGQNHQKQAFYFLVLVYFLLVVLVS